MKDKISNDFLFMNPKLSKTCILITIIFIDLLAGMEFDLYVPSFPALQDHFNVSISWLEASLSFNFMGYCISLFFVGALADNFGRKPIILIGLTIFIIGSILCLFSFSYYFLLFGRFLQGIGIAAPATLSFLIIADSYSIKEQQFWISMLNGVMNTAIGIAPIMGSYLTLYFNWQANFIALLVLALLAMLMSIFFIPSYQLPDKTEEKTSFYNYMPILKSQPLMLLIFHLVIMFTPYWIFVGISPMLYMENLGVHITEFGYYQGILAFVFAIGSIIFGFLVNRYDPKKSLQFSVLIFSISLILILTAALSNTLDPVFITITLLIFVMGQIIPTTILYPIAINFMPNKKAKISALLLGCRLIFSSIGLQVAGYCFNGTFQNLGFILITFVTITIITLIWVINNKKLNLYA